MKVEAIKANAIIKGWRIVSESGSVIAGFTTKAEAERWVNWFNDELTWHLSKVTYEKS